jgi:hypothetical protein
VYEPALLQSISHVGWRRACVAMYGEQHGSNTAVNLQDLAQFLSFTASEKYNITQLASS